MLSLDFLLELVYLARGHCIINRFRSSFFCQLHEDSLGAAEEFDLYPQRLQNSGIQVVTANRLFGAPKFTVLLISRTDINEIGFFPVIAHAPIELQPGPAVCTNQLLPVGIAACGEMTASAVNGLIGICTGLVDLLHPVKKRL